MSRVWSIDEKILLTCSWVDVPENRININVTMATFLSRVAENSTAKPLYLEVKIKSSSNEDIQAQFQFSLTMYFVG